MKATREEVYAVLSGERTYQERLWGKNPGRDERTVGECICFMETYLARARAALSTSPYPLAETEALDMIRKVTALGVFCMEVNGAPPRLL